MEEQVEKGRRVVIINGDDFGLSEDVNRGFAIAHEQGILSSASLMTKGLAVTHAVDYAKSHPELSIGLHVDLGCWAHREGEWQQLYHVVDLQDAAAVAAEVVRQLECFGSLFGHAPTHLDSHQHVHFRGPARTILMETAQKLNIPLRQLTPGLRYEGSYYGQTSTGEELHDAIRPERLMEILNSLPTGITEVGCHPACGQNIGDPIYGVEREAELRALCDPRVKATLETAGVELRSFLTASKDWWPQCAMP